MRCRIKICGITRSDDADAAEAAGADAIGFVFHPSSPRYISPEHAGSISRRLGPFIAKIGVFVNTPPETIQAVCRDAFLTGVQLHGEETPETVRDIQSFVPVIKAFRVGNGFNPAVLEQYAAAAFLLDTFVEGTSYGGTGKTFDWNTAGACTQYGRIILAGGITPENIADAIRTVNPWGVDVSSGVERSPGVKDHEKIKEVMQTVFKELLL
jgi:phosphoribosylanthranilate isomerase